MTQDTELFENSEHQNDHSTPPLCLVHYFGATGQGPPAPSVGHIAARDGNLLILEFAAPPKATRHRKSLLAKAFGLLPLLLLLVSLIGCIAAFRF